MGSNNRVPDRIQALWRKIGGDAGADRLIKGELLVINATHRYPFVWRTVEDTDLAMFSVGSLGFGDPEHMHYTPVQKIYTTAMELNLLPCPTSLIRAIREHYPEQPVGERLRFLKPSTMCGSEDDWYDEHVVSRSRAGKLALETRQSFSKELAPPGDKFVFVRPK